MSTLTALDQLRRRLYALEKALLQGFNAGSARADLQANPYPAGTAENRAWADAWQLGLEHTGEPELKAGPL